MTDLVVAGAGMAGLAAAARARELGAQVEIHEKAGRIGGSMLLSSGVIWRYASFDEFRAQCPKGDEELQRAIHERLDGDLEWLDGLGAVVVEASTGNPLTVGRRLDTRELCAALLRTGPTLRLAEPLRTLPDGMPVVLATGGFQASEWLVRKWISSQPLFLRSNDASEGDGLRIGLEAGGMQSAGMNEFYGRAMPAAGFLHPSHWVAAAQVFARHAVAIENLAGARYDGKIDWAELAVVRWIAHQPEARAWFVVPDMALSERTRYGTVAEQIERARELGAAVERRDEGVAVQVRAAITQTLGGLRVDPDARVLREDGSVVDGLFAAGGDVGGIATGGYMSNLAGALVLGKRAAEAALA